jgi:hypothetical protein
MTAMVVNIATSPERMQKKKKKIYIIPATSG